MMSGAEYGHKGRGTESTVHDGVHDRSGAVGPECRSLGSTSQARNTGFKVYLIGSGLGVPTSLKRHRPVSRRHRDLGKNSRPKWIDCDANWQLQKWITKS